MRVIGLDVHRRFAQIAELKEGVLRQRGRLDLVRHKILEFARTLDPDDEVVLEATGSTMAIVRLLKPHVGKGIIANPVQVRIIADAKVTTDRIDAAVLARLHAAGYLPEVWQPNEATERAPPGRRRAGIVQGMTRTKNRIHSVLHANLIRPIRASCSWHRGGSGSLSNPWQRTKD
jgi:transposase